MWWGGKCDVVMYVIGERERKKERKKEKYEDQNNRPFRFHIWEVFFGMLDKATQRVSHVQDLYDKARKELRRIDDRVSDNNPQEVAKDMETFEGLLDSARQEQKDTFLVTFQHFTKALGDYLADCDRDKKQPSGKWYEIMLSRFKETGRKYNETLARYGLFETLDRLIFSDMDPRLTSIVDLFKSLQL
eukprot:m.170327 g.170327  ORF g.170327 m.170327 type:complete len:188 (+) comp25146_c0_seq7:436-999(+)